YGIKTEQSKLPRDGWRPAACASPQRSGEAAAGALPEEERCTVERADASLTFPRFLQRFAFSRPVIIRGATDNSVFQALCTKDKLLGAFGDRLVRLSTANTYSYRKVDVPFQEYVEHLLKPQDPAALGSDTLYFFGDNNFTEWGPLFQKYVPPPFRIPGTRGAYSFGIAGAGSGVPFHWHGPGYSEVIFGRKRWFLYPPDKTPHFHPNETTLAWLRHTYPTLPPGERPLECTIHPGEVSPAPSLSQPRWGGSAEGLASRARCPWCCQPLSTLLGLRLWSRWGGARGSPSTLGLGGGCGVQPSCPTSSASCTGWK
uniref:Jumonji domain containing 8 n=1 Tax=Apteryx owenii TaxID=8824 RepID=A0A8B9NT94_APTOW